MRIPRWLLCSVLVVVTVGCMRGPEEQKQRFLELGNKYFKRGQYKEASLLYRKAIQQDARFSDAYYQLGLASSRLGDFRAAGQAYRRAFDNNPDNLKPFRSLVELYIAALSVPNAVRPGELRAELNQMQEAAESRHPEAFEVLYAKGRILVLQKAPGATALLARAHELEPDDVACSIAYAAALAQTNDIAKANRVVAGMLSREKPEPGAFDFALLFHARQGHRDKALEIAKAKCDTYPDQARNWLTLASMEEANGHPREARRALSEIESRRDTFPNAYELIGNYYRASRRYQEAIQQYRKGEQAEPDRANHYKLEIVFARIMSGELAKASAQLEEVLAEEPDNASALAARGAILFRRGDPEQKEAGLKDLQHAVTIMPKNLNLRFQYGNALRSANRLLEARVQYNEVLRGEPNHLGALHAVVDLDLMSQKFSDAQVRAEAALKVRPYDFSLRLGRAIALAGLEQYDDARKELVDLQEAGIHRNEISYQIARIDEVQGNYGPAEKAFRKLATADPPDPRALQELVGLQLRLGKTRDAEELLTSVAKQNLDNTSLQVAAAGLSFDTGDREKAVRQFKAILEQHPKSGLANSRYGAILFQQGQPEEGLRRLETATKAEPPVPEAFFLYGTALVKQGKLKEGAKYLRRCIELVPDHAEALNNLAFVLTELGTELDQAVGYAQRAVARQPGNADFADTLGYLYVKRNLNGNAVSVLEKIVAKHPDRGDYHYHLGLAHYHLGQRDPARREFREALKQGNLSRDQETRIRRFLKEIGG